MILDSNRAHITSIVAATQSQAQPIQRPAQITLSATPIVATPSPTGASYHVPRGPAVVANLAAPRSNVATVRTPIVVTAQTTPAHTFVRPPRTLSPAQGTAWLTTNSSNGSQIKGTPTLLSSPVRGTTVTGKQQTVGRPQLSQSIPTIRSGTLLSNAITIGPTVHSFKPGPGTVQLGNPVTLAQMLPNRTQAVVYSGNTAPQFTPTARITITTTAQSQIRPPHPRPMGSIISGTRLTVPISQVQAAQSARMVTSSQTSQRFPLGSTSSQSQPVLATATRLVTSQPSANVLGRLTVTPSTVSGTTGNSGNILNSQARLSALSTLNLQSLMAVANGGTSRVQQAGQGPKVITQPATAIHLTQIPSQLKTNSTPAVATTTTRTINVPASMVAQRSNTSIAPQAISIAKVFTTTENQTNAGAPSVFIHAPLQVSNQRHPSPSPQNSSSSSVQQQTVTSVPSTVPYPIVTQEGSSYFYENTSSTPAGSFQRTFITQQPGSFSQNQQIVRPPVGSAVNQQQFQGMRFSSMMVLDQSRGSQSISQFQSMATGQSEHQTLLEHQPQISSKVSSSPRPSILRKRDHEGSPLKAAKNLSMVLQGLNQQQSSQVPTSPPSPPRPDSRGNGHSSGGSTTISATSSPGLPEGNDDSNMILLNVKEEEDEEIKPPVEVSPRKKPRKQQLTGNDMDENHGDMQFISESITKKESYDSDGNRSDSTHKESNEISKVATLRKPATASLLNGYRQTWKATHNHYQRYSDVKPKDERRPTIIDLANQNRVLEKINGWKVYHLSTQMEDLAEQEQSVYNQLTDLLKFTESEESSKENDKEVNRVNELIKGNLQRIKIINDGMLDAKCQIMKVFDHQRHVNDILSRCVSKRNFKKREKS
ncbi:hypothetical protein ABEB36_013176 [Hypothenemus hampei]|uniref:Histone deacetylase complex subunit SAP130 C-terminal domain-containing protein n=1 Tax=Hypothenemus hampei TaxID=57062 RepID=A0ABD1E732_HYPHA